MTNTAAFWATFKVRSKPLAELVHSDDTYSAYCQIGELLDASNVPYLFEVTSDSNDAILIFTPESDRDVAAEIDAFVSEAPSMNGWKIFARRQQCHVDDALARLEQVYDIDIQDMTLAVHGNRHSLSIVMYTNVADILGEPERNGFVTLFLEHALGEQLVMDHVSETAISSKQVTHALSPQEFVDTVMRLVRQ
jgi:hypothetical protein